jgi:hypothetical protein
MIYDEDDFFIWLGITVIVSAGCLLAGIIMAASI